MESCVDFLNCLHQDMGLKILLCLEDVSDLVRVSAVSRSWRNFVIAHGICKQLCLRMFPMLQRVDHVVDAICVKKNPLEVGCSKFRERETAEREHRAYAFLARGCTSFPLRNCIADAISASSTDNYPVESIWNTLEPKVSYWSSKGQSDPAVPETLTYKLVANICVITEISVQPFLAFFQVGSPIYSSKSVRFRMGYPKATSDEPMGEPLDNHGNDNFVWTYTSPEFPMAQENHLQNFKLPQPVLCIGGILQVELLGRVQTQETDGLFYICVSHVRVEGRSLSPAFDVEILYPSGKFVLKAQNYNQPMAPDSVPCPSPTSYLRGHIRDLEQIMGVLRENGAMVEEYHWNIEEDDEFSEEDAL